MKDWKKYSDQDLVRMTMEGDTHAFTQIVSRYEGPIARTVMGIVGSGPDAEDIGQETFIRFYHSMENFRWESALGTYLTRIAINLSLNEVKKRKKKQGVFTRNEVVAGKYDKADTSDIQAKSENVDMIEKALQKLSPEFRAVVVLRLVEGYSTKETAETLHLPLGTVLSRLSRAQSELKKTLKLLNHEKRQDD